MKAKRIVLVLLPVMCCAVVITLVLVGKADGTPTPTPAQQRCYEEETETVTLRGTISLRSWDRNDMGEFHISHVLFLDQPICLKSDILGEDEPVREVHLLGDNIPLAGRHEVTGTLYAPGTGMWYVCTVAMNVLTVDGVKLADRPAEPIRESPLYFVHRYYFDLGYRKLAAVLARWKKPDEASLRKLVPQFEFAQVNDATVTQSDGQHATVAVDVTITLRNKPSEHWRGVIEMVRVGSEWKIEQMKDFKIISDH